MMLHARSLHICSFFLFLFSATVLAQSATATGNSCDWYCWVESRIESLQTQVDKITSFLFPNGNGSSNGSDNEQSSSSRSGQHSVQALYTSTFGTPPAVTSAPPQPPQIVDEDVASHVIVTFPAPAEAYQTPLSHGQEPAPDIAVHSGYRAVGYFGNWDIYYDTYKFYPQNIPASRLTHLLYSFADNHDNGTVFLTDPYADTGIHYTGDSWSEKGKNVYGAVKQLNLLKAANRNLKVLLSIGGWSNTNTKKHMDTPASTDAGRKEFASSAVQLLKDNGFDGVDVDWEYPQDSSQGSQLLALLVELRLQLDEYANTLVYVDKHGKTSKPHFALTISGPAGQSNTRNMPLGQISNIVDMINLMAYDYVGSWVQVTGHMSNLYPSLSDPGSTPANTQAVLQNYIAAGADASKINLGMPLYGRAFTSTTGLGEPYNGVGKGSSQPGVYDYRDLPLDGMQDYYDAEAGATYCFNNQSGMLISYDTVDMALKKVDFLEQNKLGGAMWWELRGDKVGDDSIITNVFHKLGGIDGSGIESSPNWLLYPDSQYDNIKRLGDKTKRRQSAGHKVKRQGRRGGFFRFLPPFVFPGLHYSLPYSWVVYKTNNSTRTSTVSPTPGPTSTATPLPSSSVSTSTPLPSSSISSSTPALNSTSASSSTPLPSTFASSLTPLPSTPGSSSTPALNSTSASSSSPLPSTFASSLTPLSSAPASSPVAPSSSSSLVSPVASNAASSGPSGAASSAPAIAAAAAPAESQIVELKTKRQAPQGGFGRWFPSGWFPGSGGWPGPYYGPPPYAWCYANMTNPTMNSTAWGPCAAAAAGAGGPYGGWWQQFYPRRFLGALFGQPQVQPISPGGPAGNGRGGRFQAIGHPRRGPSLKEREMPKQSVEEREHRSSRLLHRSQRRIVEEDEALEYRTELRLKRAEDAAEAQQNNNEQSSKGAN